MARNGSGTMSIPYPDFVAGTTIQSSQVDANNTDLVNEITNSIAADGQTTPTANLPMGGFHLTGLASGTDATDSVHLRDVQYQAWKWAGTAGGTADALTLSPSPAIAAYAAGQAFRFIAASNNTGAATVAVSGLTTKAIQNGGVALEANDIISGQMYEAIYDGTQFQLSSLYAFRGIPGDLELISADSGAGIDPNFSLYRKSSSPAASDSLGVILLHGNDSSGSKVVYARINAEISDPTNGSIDGILRFRIPVNGGFDNRFNIGAGAFTGNATGGDKGADTINAAILYENGTALSAKYQADLDVPSQAEAEAGTATTERVWTAQRISQAIAALQTSEHSRVTTLTPAGTASAETWSSLSGTATRLHLKVKHLRASSAQSLQLRVTISGTAQSGVSDYAYVLTRKEMAASSPPTPEYNSDDTADSILLTAVGNTMDTSQGWSGDIIIDQPNGSLEKHIWWQGTYEDNTTGNPQSVSGSGVFYGSSSALDGFSLLVSSGNLTGTIEVWTDDPGS